MKVNSITKLPQYLSIAQVSARTTFSPTTIRRYIDAGRLPVVKLGRKMLIRESDVLSLIEAHTETRGAAWQPSRGVR